MEDKPEYDSSERNFGHCIVTWEIKNYGLAVWQKHWEVETPEFFVHGPGSRVTKWKLILETDSSEPDSIPSGRVETDSVESKLQSGTLVLNLKRSKFDQGPDTVWVDWKVSCLGIDGKMFSVTQGNHFFNNKYKYGLHLGIIFDLEREFHYNSGIMTFQCQMIIDDRSVSEKLDSSVDIDLCALSEDLQWSLMQKKFCDLQIELGEKNVLAHKAVLCSRSKSFEGMIGEKGLDNIDLSGADYDGMLRILEYTYSSDLQDAVERPSISVYDSIIRMNISELAAYYAPEELKIRTKIDVNKLTYMWLIKDFSAKEDNCLSSPIVCKNVADAAWQIHLYPRGVDGKSEYISVYVEYIEGKISDDLCIQCSVMKEDETFQSWKTLQKSVKVGPMFIDEKFMKREILLKMLNEDLLKLGFKVRMCIAKEHSPLHIKTSPHVPVIKKKSLEKLSEDMSSLRQSKKYTDVILSVGNKEIKAHKFILSARSCVLSSMLEETKDNLILSNITPDILEILLDYMYCAVLNASDVKILLEVYKAAEEFVISRLREKCSRVLRDSLAMETVCDVLSFSDDYNDQLLKEAALKFMRLNVSIFEQEVWKELKCKKPFLCNEVESSPKQICSEEQEKDCLLQCDGRGKVPNRMPSDDCGKSELLNVERENASIVLLGRKVNLVVETVRDSGLEKLLKEVHKASCKVEKILTGGDHGIEKALKESNSNGIAKLKEPHGNGIEKLLIDPYYKEVAISHESRGQEVKAISTEPGVKTADVPFASDCQAVAVSSQTNCKVDDCVSIESNAKTAAISVEPECKAVAAVSLEPECKAVAAISKEL